MPLAILLQLVAAFAVSAVTTGLNLWRAVQAGRPPEVTTLVILNLMAIALAFLLMQDARWRAAWSDLKKSSKEVIPLLNSSSLRPHPGMILAQIKREPKGMGLSQPSAMPPLIWSKSKETWGSRPDVTEYVAAQILRGLAGLNLPDSYFGRTHQAASRFHQWMSGSAKPRVVRSRSPRTGEPITYTYRRDRGRLRMVAVFTVRDDGDKVSVWWEAMTLRVGARDVVFSSSIAAPCWLLGAIGYSPPAAAVAIILIPFLVPFNHMETEQEKTGMFIIVIGILMKIGGAVVPAWILLLAAWGYFLLRFPPGRGWTPLWARATRNRMIRKPGDYPSPDDMERRLADEFSTYVHNELRRIHGNKFD